MAQAVREAVVQRLARPLGAQRRPLRRLEDLAGGAEDVGAQRAGTDRGHGSDLGLAGQRVHRSRLLRRLADHERPGHVGEAARRLVLRPDVDDQRRPRGYLPVSGFVALGRLRP
jgi:hypothetical protein